MLDGFSIPIVLFIFKRKNTLARIIERIRVVQPRKMYIISDGPRCEDEKLDVEEVRLLVEKLLDWDCEIIKNFAKTNRGVYANIAGGAKWVLSKEDNAIFLEDDNLPEVSFFYFCKEMLEYYRNDDRILWICGTNYLGKYSAEDDASYVFTKHMLPCGWATWAKKFIRYYDGELDKFSDPVIQKKIKNEYKNKKLFYQQFVAASSELYRKGKGERFQSWDFQMAMSIRQNSVFGIAPCINQICNIGADQFSTHGGTSMEKVMTKRFCEIKTSPLNFPLKHPKAVMVDSVFERKIGNIILFPFSIRLKGEIIAKIKSIFGIPRFEHFTKENIKKYFWERRDL